MAIQSVLQPIIQPIIRPVIGLGLIRAPSTLTAAIDETSGGIELTASEVSGADSYSYSYAIDGGAWQSAATGQGTSYTFTPSETGEYSFGVSAVKGSTESRKRTLVPGSLFDDVPNAEGISLMAHYYSNSGATWSGNTNWTTSTTIGNYQNVTVTDGHVTNVDLTSENADWLWTSDILEPGFTKLPELLDTLSLSGEASDTDDAIVKFNLHYSNKGTTGNADVFLGGNCLTDFSDIAFTDDSHAGLEHLIHATDNFELVPDDSLYRHTLIMQDGRMYASGDNGVYRSDDNGATWSQLRPNTDFLILLYVTENDALLAMKSATNELMRAVDDGDYPLTWATVLDMSTDNGQIQWCAMDGDSNGNLYAGQYQDANGATIYKSTDDGENWAQVYYSESYVHIHGLRVDPNTDYIYAGVDGSPGTLLRSMDAGSTWESIDSTYKSNFSAMVFDENYRLFGGGGSAARANESLYKTLDDSSFTTQLYTPYSIQGLVKHSDYLFGMAVSFGYGAYSQIYLSRDDGDSWQTVWLGDYEGGLNFYGYEYTHERFGGEPTGDDYQYVIGGNNGDLSYTPLRLYPGGNYYQALCFLKLSTLLSAGSTVKIWRKF